MVVVALLVVHGPTRSRPGSDVIGDMAEELVAADDIQNNLNF